MNVLVVGRFQPFHKGHLHIIKEALKKSNVLEDNLIKIAVGSSQESFTKNNPFTFYERKEMIEKAIKQNQISNFLIFEVEDKNSDPKWIKELESKAGDFDICYTNNECVQKIFLKNKKIVSGIELLDRDNLSSTNIRKLIAFGKEIGNLVPNSTLKVMKKTDGFKRVINIDKTDYKRIFTIGHSNRKMTDFLSLLKEYNIQTVIDIRSGPKSKNNPQFDSNNLQKELAKKGIIYKGLKELGGHRKQSKDSLNDFWQNKSFRAFADYMKSDEFKQGILALEDFAKKDRTIIMCAEILPWRCHRSLVSDFLLTKGFSVTHIINHNQTREHELNKNIVYSNKNLLYKKDK